MGPFRCFAESRKQGQKWINERGQTVRPHPKFVFFCRCSPQILICGRKARRSHARSFPYFQGLKGRVNFLSTGTTGTQTEQTSQSTKRKTRNKGPEITWAEPCSKVHRECQKDMEGIYLEHWRCPSGCAEITHCMSLVYNHPMFEQMMRPPLPFYVPVLRIHASLLSFNANCMVREKPRI